MVSNVTCGVLKAINKTDNDFRCSRFNNLSNDLDSLSVFPEIKTMYTPVLFLKHIVIKLQILKVREKRILETRR